MVHAWDQAAFSDSEPEEDGGLPHEIPQPVFRERDLNRSLDYNILNRVNRYFERLFDQRLIYRQVEEATVNAQADVFAILTNIIACQQQHKEALRYAADFWQQCHNDLYGEFIQLQHGRVARIYETVNHGAKSYGKRVIIDFRASKCNTENDGRIYI